MPQDKALPDRPGLLVQVLPVQQVPQDQPVLPEPQVLQDKVSQDLPALQVVKVVTVLQVQQVLPDQ